ncbi:hypothetical protein ACOTTU_17630 [Roseobacter sp. EG26]|uniref:hypothetical protein n=1 Tax=Roseobacter sp. EG26 TaxID=3412477 RepID=UPI00261636DE|nr:hypothetical protein [uncultured Roseobacter sp.]
MGEKGNLVTDNAEFIPGERGLENELSAAEAAEVAVNLAKAEAEKLSTSGTAKAVKPRARKSATTRKKTGTKKR